MMISSGTRFATDHRGKCGYHTATAQFECRVPRSQPGGVSVGLPSAALGGADALSHDPTRGPGVDGATIWGCTGFDGGPTETEKRARVRRRFQAKNHSCRTSTENGGLGRPETRLPLSRARDLGRFVTCGSWSSLVRQGQRLCANWPASRVLDARDSSERNHRDAHGEARQGVASDRGSTPLTSTNPSIAGQCVAGVGIWGRRQAISVPHVRPAGRTRRDSWERPALSNQKGETICQ